jgi:hypothetical protein
MCGRYDGDQARLNSGLIPPVDYAPLITITVPHLLPTQKIVVTRITPTELLIPEFPVSFELPSSEPVPALLATYSIANNASTPEVRPTTVPTTITRVVTINKSVELLFLPAASTLSQARCRQCRQQKKTREYQPYLAIVFH